ncbi:hypothetical protein ACQCT5_06220 [Sutcliffiella halmapala]
MQIKISSKQLYLIILLLVVLSSFTFYMLQPEIEAREIEQEIAKGSPESKQRLFDLLESKRINKEEKIQLIETFMIQKSYSEFNEVFLTPPNINAPVKKEVDFISLEEKYPYLLYYLKNADVDGGYVVKVAKILNAEGWKKNNTEEVQSQLMDAYERYQGDPTNGAGLSQVIIQQQITDGKMKEALSFIETLLAKPYGINYYLSLSKTKVELNARMNQQSEALDTLDDIDSYLEDNEIKADDSFLQSLSGLKEMMNLKQEPGSVSGSIKFNEEILHDVGVYLVKHPDSSMGFTQALKYRTMTDENGEFEFEDILPGKYKLVVGVDHTQLNDESFQSQINYPVEIKGDGEDNEIDVELHPLITLTTPINYEEVTGEELKLRWEEVPGAYSYAISFGLEGSGTSTLVFSDVRKNELEISKDEMRLKRLGVKKNNAANIEKALLGFSNPSSIFYWYVTAYDREGNLLARSNGYQKDAKAGLPYFQISHNDLSAADEVLLEGDISGALDRYRENIDKNPEDVHSLNMVRSLNIYEETYDRKVQLVKQKPYLIQLAELSPNIEVVSDLMEYYYYTKSWDDVERIYREYLSLDQYDLFVELLYIKSQYSQGNYEKAREMVDGLYVKEFQSDLVVAHIALAEWMIGEKTNAAEYAAIYSNSRLDWEAKINQLDFMDDKEIMGELYDLYTSGKTTQIEKKLEEVPDSHINDFWRSILTYAK